jgi:hypothetical protein
VREIEGDAERMERDLEEFGIARPANPPSVEPLLAAEFDHAIPAIDRTENMSATQKLSARREVVAFTKATRSRTNQAQASRTREKVRSAKEVLAASQEGGQKRKRDEKKAPKRVTTTGRVDWDRVVGLMQGETL